MTSPRVPANPSLEAMTVLGGRDREQVLDRLEEVTPRFMDRFDCEEVVDALEALPPQVTDDPVRAAADVQRQDGDWPQPTHAPEPSDVVAVLMTEEMARRFEARCLLSNTQGRTELSPPLLFREDDVATYIISVAASAGEKR